MKQEPNLDLPCVDLCMFRRTVFSAKFDYDGEKMLGHMVAFYS